MSSRPKRKRGQKGGNNAIDVDGNENDNDSGSKTANDSKKKNRQKSPEEESQSQQSQLCNTHPHSQLPFYLSDAFSDLYGQDGLVAFGRGLGWLDLLCAFVRYYGDTSEDGYAASVVASMGGDVEEGENDKIDGKEQSNKRRRRKPPLIFVLNLRENERNVLLSRLSSWGTPPRSLPTIITNESGQSNDRAALYARGGVFVVTSRILIVDLLQGVADPKDIDGMLVAHADKVVGEKSTEAFILRIYRSRRYFSDDAFGSNSNRGGFIKAFTDDPSSLVGGFAKVDKVMKSLQVQRLYLYPRFHAAVAEELERQPPVVTELHQPLSDKMKEIQNNLAAAMRACLRDLRSKCQVVDFSFLFDAGGGDNDRKRKRGGGGGAVVDDVDYYGNNNKRSARGDRATAAAEDWKFTIQQCISTNFGYILGRQLEGDWHRLGRDVKQSINDLKTLSKLFHHLIEYGE